MKLFFIILVLILSLQSWAKADDIKDFEIEGISIGDNALDHFSKSKIKNNQKNYYKDDRFIPVYIKDKINFKNYDGIQFHIDKNYKIVAMEGVIVFKNNFKECKKKQKIIDQEFKKIFSSIPREESGMKSHTGDSSGKSKYISIYYDFDSQDFISITCYDWTENMNYVDNLRVSIITKKLQDWINTDAY